jgi:hypothetical protein
MVYPSTTRTVFWTMFSGSLECLHNTQLNRACIDLCAVVGIVFVLECFVVGPIDGEPVDNEDSK